MKLCPEKKFHLAQIDHLVQDRFVTIKLLSEISASAGGYRDAVRIGSIKHSLPCSFTGYDYRGRDRVHFICRHAFLAGLQRGYRADLDFGHLVRRIYGRSVRDSVVVDYQGRWRHSWRPVWLLRRLRFRGAEYLHDWPASDRFAGTDHAR